MRTTILSSAANTASSASQSNQKCFRKADAFSKKYFQSMLLLIAVLVTGVAVAGGANNLRVGNTAGTHIDADLTTNMQVAITDANCSDSGSVTFSQPGSNSLRYNLTDSAKASVASGYLNNGASTTVVLAPGTYTLVAVDSTDHTVSQTIVIGGNGVPAPIAAFQITTGNSLVNINEAQTSQMVYVTATIGEPATYSWDFGNGTTGTDGQANIMYKEAGTYVINLTVQNTAGCTATAAQTITIDAATTTGVQTVNSASGLAIWSNNNTVYVDFRKANDADATINVYDLTGRQISSERNGQLLYQKQIDNTQAGYFIVAVDDNKSTTTQKVFIDSTK